MRDLKLLHFNAQGANNKRATITHATLDGDFDVVCLQDTRFAPKKADPKKSKFELAGYRVFHKPKSTSCHGVWTAVREVFPTKEVTSQYQFGPNVEHISVLLYLHPAPVIIHNIYWVDGDIDISAALRSQTPSILCGDFNAHHHLWGPTRDGRGDRLLDLIETTASHTILNTGVATHRSGTGIDITIAHNSLAGRCDWSLHPHLASDHYAVQTTIHNIPSPPPMKPTARWCLRRADWDMYKVAMSQYMEATPPPDDDAPLEVKVQYATDVINDAAKKSIPRTAPGPRSPNAWYANAAMKVTKNEVNYHLKRFRRDNTADNNQRLNEALVLHRQTCEEARQEAWVQWTEELNGMQTTTGDMWRRIKAVSGAPPPVPRHPDPQKKAEELCQSFAERSDSSNLPPRVRQALQAVSDVRQEKADAAIREEHETDQPFTAKEFEAASSHRRDTSPGDDEVSYSMIANATDALKTFMLGLVNASWDAMKLPGAWKDANMAAIPKPFQDAFRPISLLACLNKVMEVMVLRRINWASRPFHPHLLGFRRGVGTEDAIATVISQISRVKKSKSRAKATAVFLDLEKAFELANRDAIIDAMVDSGLKGKLLGWCRDFLTDRRARVCFQGKMSEYRTFANGTPQGSSLSPTLFNFLVDQLLRIPMPPATMLLAYADDLVIVSIRDSVQSSQKVLNTLELISPSLGFKFSTAKTKAMYFCLNNPAVCLRLCDQQIEWVKEFKYLGVIIDKQLSFASHVKYLTKRVQSRLNAMRAITGLPGGANTRVLKQVYMVTIRPILDYGCLVLSFACSSARRQLERLQNRAIRTMLGVYRWSNPEAGQRETDIMPLKFRHEARLAVFMDKVLRKAQHPLHTQLQTALEKSREVFTADTWLLQAADAWRRHIPVKDYVPEPVERLPTPPWSSVGAQLQYPQLQAAKKSYSAEQLLEIAQRSISQAESRLEGPKVIYYTDGSVFPDGTAGFAFHAAHATKSYRASDWCSTVQTELAAIREAVRDSAHQPEPVVIIHTDSLGALQNISHNSSRDNVGLNQDIKTALAVSGKQFIFNWVPSHTGIPGNDAADAAAKEGAQKAEPDVLLPASSRQTRAQVFAAARGRWEKRDSDLQLDFPALQWNLQLPCCPDASAALCRLPRRTQSAINRMRLKCPTHRLIVEKNPRCAYCEQDISCQHTHDLVECPRTRQLRGKLLDHLPDEDHASDATNLAINILKAQTRRCYAELSQYEPYRPPDQ